MNTEYTQAVKDRLVATLADTTLGFNKNLLAVATDYGIKAFTVDWDENSKNFFETNIDPDEIETSTPLKYPLVTLCALQSNNTHRTMFQTFSGEVTMQLTFFLSWAVPRLPQNTEKLVNAVEAAVIRTLCNPDWQGNFTGPVTFNRTISASRSPVEIGAEHWRQPLRFNVTFQLDTN